MRRASALVATTVAAWGSAAGAQAVTTRAAAAASSKAAFHAARVLDPATGTVMANGVILVDHDTIVRVASLTAAAVPKEYGAMVELGDVTVLPGLIDVHTHLTSSQASYYDGLFRRSVLDAAVRAPGNAKRTLEAGFTTVRDVGAGDYLDVALRNAINAGDLPGPRMFVATTVLSATGGHGDLNGFSPYLRIEGMGGPVDGIEPIRKRVRTNVKYGADVIKVTAGAGVLSEEESVGAPQYTQAELDALVDEARMWGRKVAAHAHGGEAIKRAIRAGVASVEHAGLIDDEGVALAKQHGTYLVPDVYTDVYIIEQGPAMGLPEKILDKERQLRKSQEQNWGKARAAGVKFAFGTDAGVYPHGDNAKQFRYLVEVGFPPLMTIQMATVNAADLLGNAKVGRLTPGAYADFIAVKGDPVADVKTLEAPLVVVKGGVMVKGAAGDTKPKR
ncbi:MAG: amidohydrolase family protein [Gemmatimonadetes bacterium]|nr:amidohydrolase family protein [Gemmatimonadota bacterium]